MFLEFLLFNLSIIIFLILDLKVFHRHPHEVRFKEALGWSFFWIILSLFFGLGIYFWQDLESAIQFLTAYIVEKSLSVDNIFVFILIFTYFQVPENYKHRVLFWGIVGALVSRALFILAGISLIQEFHFILYLLGAFLIFIGIKILFRKEETIYVEKNPVLKVIKKYLPITNNYCGKYFFVKEGASWKATPLFLVLLVIESTDILFAIDSIPAVLAITQDPFLAYTSNILAILGLRALYFALAKIIPLFSYLHYGLGLILAFVGIKMVIGDLYPIPTLISLAIIVAILTISISISLIASSRKQS